MSKTGVAALNVYKKVAIIRNADDKLSYEESDGSVKTIADLHLAAAATTLVRKAKPKDDIPVPNIRNVDSYAFDIPPNYQCPKAYVRHRKPSHQELKDNLEYVVDAEDEVWLFNNSKFGGASAKSDRKRSANGDEKGALPQLPLAMLEIMLDVLEKATAFDTIVTMDQAETLILKKLPQLYHMFPLKARAGVTTLKHVLSDVYNYWVSKRSKLKRPLLRRFWPVTSSDDTNPHLVFRPREKEKYKLRKKRQNDMDAFRKLEQLKQDFHHVRILCALVKQREEIYRSLVTLQKEWFQQKFYDAVDTSGKPRVSKALNKVDLDALLTVEHYFDIQDGWKRGKKSRRGSQSGKLSRSTSPVPDFSGHMRMGGELGPSAGMEPRRPMIVAGQNHGEPAPNFLHPLSTREAYTTSWDNATPHVTSFVDATPEPTYRFRHRPRVGRGGRLCIDRMPLPIDPNMPPPTFYRAGNSQLQPGPPKRRLTDLLPPPLDRERLSQQIESISLSALKEEYEAPPRLMSPAGEADENDGDVVVVKLKDWLDTDEQYWGEERYAIGPI